MTNFSNIANEGIDFVGDALIDLLPTGSILKDAAKKGLDLGTDLIFDRQVGKEVAVSEHSDLKDLATKLLPLIIHFVDSKILQPVNLPFFEGTWEEKAKQGLLLELEATLGQAITNFGKKE